MQNLRRRVILSLLFALVVFVALAFYADAPRLLGAFERFDWRFLPLALGVTLLNYLLRFARWHYYLRVLKIHNLTRRDSFLIFLTGFSLTMTPGKLGELLKSLLLKTKCDTPISYSAPIIAIERLTDALGMVILAAVGLTFFPEFGIGALIALLAVIVAFVVIVQQRALAERLFVLGTRVRVLARFVGVARNLYESAYLLLQLKPLAFAIGIAVAAWFAECVAFFFVLMGVGLAPSPLLLLQATFIYAAASLFGAAMMTPGGLGATEGGMALLLEQIVAIARESAVAATLIVRLCTLWFAVLLGVIALLLIGLPPSEANKNVPTTG
ncbi:MAG: flippase-like domain-containing protein [Chloroflexi bacterium]|nr:flippase-like domain-containing protein [Chloroflexota bacterium]